MKGFGGEERYIQENTGLLGTGLLPHWHPHHLFEAFFAKDFWPWLNCFDFNDWFTGTSNQRSNLRFRRFI
jgi:hypothetical protein